MERVIGSIDIPVNSFFWMLRSWQDSTLVTIDGNARFSEMSFEGANRVRLRPLVDFPRQGLDGMLEAHPEYGLVISKSARRFHIADVAAGRTRSFVPFLTGQFREQTPILLDGNAGLVAFPYRANNRRIHNNFFIVYNFRTSENLGRFGAIESIEARRLIRFAIDSENIIAQTFTDNLPQVTYFYNWRSGERTDNELTEKLSGLDISGLSLGRLENIDLQRRFLFINIRPPVRGQRSQNAKVTWKEGFTDVSVVPLGYLVPEGRWQSSFFLFSANGQWATNFMSGFRGLRNESLAKRTFLHLDRRYPNGISMPVFTDGYRQPGGRDQGAFVNHPVHGMSFAEEVTRVVNRRERRFLRLHRMDDVLADINRQLLAKARGIIL
jgi:hypothetical protein